MTIYEKGADVLSFGGSRASGGTHHSSVGRFFPRGLPAQKEALVHSSVWVPAETRIPGSVFRVDSAGTGGGIQS